MTRTDFLAFREAVARRGFSHVLTLAGPVPLSRWFPYGAFRRENGAESERSILGFTWHTAISVRDCDPVPNGPGAGLWTFLRPEEV